MSDEHPPNTGGRIRDPAALLQNVGKWLKPGGVSLVSLQHPLAAGEWLDVDGEGDGLFLQDYFHPPADVRPADAPAAPAVSRAWPVADVVDWHLHAGLTITRLAEPKPAPVSQMTTAQDRSEVPYDSDTWRDYHARMSRIPFTLVVRAQRLT